MNSPNSTFSKSEALFKMPILEKTSPDEPYFIRQFNPNLPQDNNRVDIMHRHPFVSEYMDVTGNTPPEESQNYDIATINNDFLRHGPDRADPVMLFAVANEKGEALSWVEYYKDPDHPLPEEIANTLDLPENALVLQVSYERMQNTGWPKAIQRLDKALFPKIIQEKYPGVAVSGVRQSLIKLHEMEQVIAKADGKPPREIIVYAFTEEKNVASEAVLRKNGFTLAEHTHEYDGVQNHVWHKVLGKDVVNP